MIWKLPWLRRRENRVAKFWRGVYSTEVGKLDAEITNLKGLIEERDAKISGLQNKLLESNAKWMNEIVRKNEVIQKLSQDVLTVHGRERACREEIKKLTETIDYLNTGGHA